MPKYSAFGATLGMGTRQIETATVVGTIVNPGNATFVLTAAGMTGSPITRNVAVLSGDTSDVVAAKAIADFLTVANITNWFDVGGSGSQIVLTRKIAVANDGTMNLSSANGTCTGLTAQPTSVDTLAGVVSTNIAYIKAIGGVALALDTVDVTTHDSLEAWEEVIATILRTGEMSLDLVYDPNQATHAAGAGLVDYAENKRLAYFKVTFVTSYDWYFAAYVSKFEPDAPVDGALTAKASLKVTGKPLLV